MSPTKTAAWCGALRCGTWGKTKQCDGLKRFRTQCGFGRVPSTPSTLPIVCKSCFILFVRKKFEAFYFQLKLRTLSCQKLHGQSPTVSPGFDLSPCPRSSLSSLLPPRYQLEKLVLFFHFRETHCGRPASPGLLKVRSPFPAFRPSGFLFFQDVV